MQFTVLESILLEGPITLFKTYNLWNGIIQQSGKQIKFEKKKTYFCLIDVFCALKIEHKVLKHLSKKRILKVIIRE